MAIYHFNFYSFTSIIVYVYVCTYVEVRGQFCDVGSPLPICQSGIKLSSLGLHGKHPHLLIY